MRERMVTMKKNMMIQRLAAALLTGVMAVSVMGMNVFAAEEGAAVTSVEFSKTVEAEENTLMPNTAFTFSVVPGAAATEDGKVIYAGIAGGAYFAAGAETVTFAPEDAVNEKSTQISLDDTKFTTPGIYRYVVTETAGAYDGITYDTKSYNLDVYVVNGTDGLMIQGATLNAQGAIDKTPGFTNIYATNDLTVKKVITGNQADMTKEFAFTITINGADGEQYKVKNSDGTFTTITSGTPVTIELGNNEEVKIYGLSANDTYTVVEEDCSDDGYTTTIEGTDTKDGLTAAGKVDTGDDAVTYTNTKEVTTPTGIMMDMAPYMLMVLAAAVMAVVFLRRKNTQED